MRSVPTDIRLFPMLVFGGLTLLAGCGGEAAPNGAAAAAGAARAVASTAAPYADVDLDACLAIARGTLEPDAERCPGFISDVIEAPLQACIEAKGLFVPFRNATLWSLDVDADGNDELLFDATQNFRCDGAPGVLDCGSLGCPVGLYGERDGGWVTLARLNAEDAAAAEVLAPARGERYGAIRGGCVGARPCDEWHYYSWNGTEYAWSAIDDDGNWVDFAPSGQWRLRGETAVRAAPEPNARTRDRYPAGTEVIVIGEARDAPGYLYVSPCNACRSGFVPVGALTR